MTLQHEKNLVEEVIQEWLLALNANDGGKLKALWDQSYDQIIYIAEENDQAIFGWPDVNNYYDNLVLGVERADWQSTSLVVDVLGDVAYAYLTFALDTRQKDLDRDMVFRGRNTFIFHKVAGQWKIIHYHESLSRDSSHDTWGWFFND